MTQLTKLVIITMQPVNNNLKGLESRPILIVYLTIMILMFGFLAVQNFREVIKDSKK